MGHSAIDGNGDFVPGARSPGILRNPGLPYTRVPVVTEDGAELHVRVYGPTDRPTVVLVHGFGCLIEFWNPQINVLAEHYRVVVYDQRMCGRSTDGSRAPGADAFGDDLAAVLAATVPAGHRAVLVGHSYGGISIMSWAKRHPQQVPVFADGVVLANTVAERLRANTSLVPLPPRWKRSRRAAIAQVANLTVPLPAFAPVRLGVRTIGLCRYAGTDVTTLAAAFFTHWPGRARSAWARGLYGLDLVPGLRNLTVPVTVVTGSLDRLVLPSASHRIAEVLRETGHLERFVELPKTGHCASLERPELFNAELRHLLGPASGIPDAV